MPFSSKMSDEMDEQFPWVPIVKRGFLKSFSGDYEIGTLELLQGNIAEEIQRVKYKYDFGTAKLLFECIEDFYYHFCRKWYQRKRFTSHMEVAWVHILSNFIKIGLILSRGNKKSKWILQVLTAITKFQGKKNLIYDALLSVHSLSRKYQHVYGAILMHVLIYAPAFIPVIIDDPAECLKAFLLIRRLKILIKDPTEKAMLRMKSSKIMAPPSLSIWLLNHDFNVTCMNSARKIHLGINICKKLGKRSSEKEVVEALRKILLPGISTERKAEKKVHRIIKKKNIGVGLENIQTCNTDSFEKRNSVNMTCSGPFLPEDGKMEIILNKTKIKRKKKRKYIDMASDDQGKSKKQNVSLTEPIRKQIEKMHIIAEENPDIVNESSSSILLPKDISKFTKNQKKKQKQHKGKKLNVSGEEIPFITVNSESDAEVSPVIIDEINANEPNSNESMSVSKHRNVDSTISCSDDDQPVIVTEIKHYSNFDLSSSYEKKNQSVKAQQKSNLETEIKTTTEFVSELNFFNQSDAIQVANDTVSDMKQENVSMCAKSEIIGNGRDLKTADKSHTSEEMLSPCTRNSSPMKSEPNITDECLAFEQKNSISSNIQIDTQDSCIGSSSSFSKDQVKLNSESNISEKEIKKSLDNKTNINASKHDIKLEDETQDSSTDSLNPIGCNQQNIFVSNLYNECLISVKETSISSEIQASIIVNDQNCEKQDDGSTISFTIKEHLDHVSETDEESAQDSLVQTEILNHSPNQATDMVENCRNLQPGLISEKPADRNEEFPIENDFKKETACDTYISQEAVEILESHQFCTSDHSSSAGSYTQKIEIQKDDQSSVSTDEFDSSNKDSCTQKNDHPLVSTDGFISDTNKIDFQKTSLINIEITENDSKDIVQDEPLFENSPLSFVVQKEKIEKNKVSESTDCPLNNISLKTNEILSQKVAGTGLESKISLTCTKYSLNTNNSPEETEAKEEKLITDSSLSNKLNSEVVYNSDSNSSFKVDNPKEIKDNVCVDMQRPSQNISTQIPSKFQITGLFYHAKSPFLKVEPDLPENSPGSINKQILDDQIKQNLNGETKSNEVKTPNRSAASELMENMLKLVELASNVKDESARQNILKGDRASTPNSLALKSTSSLISLPTNEKCAKYLSFLDISSGNESSICENPDFARLSSKSSEFAQYREFSNDQDDNRSEDALSENKSIFKTDASEYHSEASNDTESGESNCSPRDCNSPAISADVISEACSPKNSCDTYVVKTEFSSESANERDQFCNENYIKESQEAETGNILPQGCMLNPIVNLGVRCDSERFILGNSSVSTDYLSSEKNSAALPEFKDGGGEISETKLFVSCSKPVHSPSEGSKTSVNDFTKKPEVIEDLPSDMQVLFKEQHDEIRKVDNDVKVAIQSEQKDSEFCLTTDKKLPISDKDQESIDLANKKILSHDEESIGCDNGQELSDTKKEKEPSLSTKLREKSSSADKDNNVSNQNIPTTHCRTLRSRNTPASSSSDIRKNKSQTVTKGSSKKLKKEINMNLGFDFSELSLNSPKSLKRKRNDSSNKTCSEVLKDDESPTSSQEIPCRRLTRSSIILSSESAVKEQDADPEGYNLRSRKSVIMPGKLKL